MDAFWASLGEAVQEALATGAVTVALVAVLLYLLRLILPYWLAREAEKEKSARNEALEHTKAQLKIQGDLTLASIKAQQDRALEMTRTEFRALAVEHEARVSKLQERRTAAIAELYAYLTVVP